MATLAGCLRGALLALLLLSPMASAAIAQDVKFITLASTTSTRDSGLFDWLLPKFTAASGIRVRVVAVGTGQALRLARAGDADVLLVHHRASEEAFVAAGFGLRRYPVMVNDFVIVGPGVGPASDPAAISGMTDAARALKAIAAAGAVFVSRGDDSGTNKAERGLWRAADIDIDAASGGWYRETGAGMGATLNTAAAMNGYALADRGSWLAFQNRGDLRTLVEGDRRLRNPYGVIAINPARHPHVKARAAQEFIDWLISNEGQSAIDAFRVNGEVLFRGDAG